MSSVAKSISASTSKTDILTGLSNTGTYEVLLTETGASYLTHDSGASTSDSVSLASASPSPVNPIRFTWDSSTPLYVFRASGTGTVSFILTPISSVGLSVNCS